MYEGPGEWREGVGREREGVGREREGDGIKREGRKDEQGGRGEASWEKQAGKGWDALYGGMGEGENERERDGERGAGRCRRVWMDQPCSVEARLPFSRTG